MLIILIAVSIISLTALACIAYLYRSMNNMNKSIMKLKNDKENLFGCIMQLNYKHQNQTKLLNSSLQEINHRLDSIEEEMEQNYSKIYQRLKDLDNLQFKVDTHDSRFSDHLEFHMNSMKDIKDVRHRVSNLENRANQELNISESFPIIDQEDHYSDTPATGREFLKKPMGRWR